ncbi:hypothetical protein EJB05_31164, partial [Eragrostis curvula]
MKARRDAAAQQQGRQVRHRAVAQHAVLPDQRVHGPSRPDGRVHWQPHHLTAQQIADAQNSAAADEVARVQDLLAVQLQAEEEVARQQHERMRQALDAARERNYPHQAQAMGLIGAAPGQMALQAQQLAAAAEKIAREQQAAAMGLDVTQLGNGQQTVQRFSVPTVKVAREQDMNLMEQAAAFARAMSGATNMAASLPGGSADAGTFLVHQQTQQPQPVNALGFQTGASLPPPLADLPHQQPGDGGEKDIVMAMAVRLQQAARVQMGGSLPSTEPEDVGHLKTETSFSIVVYLETDSEMAMQWTLIYQLASRLRALF